MDDIYMVAKIGILFIGCSAYSKEIWCIETSNYHIYDIKTA